MEGGLAIAFGDFLDLSEQAARAAQLDHTDTTGDLAQAKQAVNQGYLGCTATGDPWTFLSVEGQWTATAGSDKYSFSSVATAISLTAGTINDIVGLQNDTEGNWLHGASWEDLERLAHSTQEPGEGTGCPTHWTTWGDLGAPVLRVYPSPDAAYTFSVFCYLTPAAMTQDTDTPLIPLSFRHRVLVPYAAALLLEHKGGAEAGAQYERLMRRYEDAFTAMRTALATFKRPTGNAVEPGLFERRDADWWTAEGAW